MRIYWRFSANHLHTLRRFLLRDYFLWAFDTRVFSTKPHTILQRYTIQGVYFRVTDMISYDIFTDCAQGHEYNFPLEYSDRLNERLRGWLYGRQQTKKTKDV